MAETIDHPFHPSLTVRDGGRDWEILDPTTGNWIEGRWLCGACLEVGKVEMNEPRYSFGCYAGKYCDEHWKTSGYRDATDPDAEFDPDYAGERIDDDY